MYKFYCELIEPEPDIKKYPSGKTYWIYASKREELLEKLIDEIRKENNKVIFLDKFVRAFELGFCNQSGQKFIFQYGTIEKGPGEPII